jgi:Flp pilus assembly protein TadD
MTRLAKIIPITCLLLLAACESMPGLPGMPGSSHEAKPAAPATSAATPAKPGQAAGGAPAAANVPPPPAPNADQVALKDGIAAYNNGEYAAAIKRLSSPDIAAGSKATQLSALKYLAFSYCLTNRATLCRQQFEKALKLDPAFDLAPGEHGHPLWGPVFTRAKKAK